MLINHTNTLYNDGSANGGMVHSVGDGKANMKCHNCIPVYEALSTAGLEIMTSGKRKMTLCRWDNNGSDEVWIYPYALSADEIELAVETIKEMGLKPILPI